MKLFVCLILVAIIFVVLGCDTPDGETLIPPNNATIPPTKEIPNNADGETGLTESEKVFIDRAWATGALNKKNWDHYLEKVALESDRDNAVFDAFDNSFKARLRRSREKWRRRLLYPPTTKGE